MFLLISGLHHKKKQLLYSTNITVGELRVYMFYMYVKMIGEMIYYVLYARTHTYISCELYFPSCDFFALFAATYKVGKKVVTYIYVNALREQAEIVRV